MKSQVSNKTLLLLSNFTDNLKKLKRLLPNLLGQEETGEWGVFALEAMPAGKVVFRESPRLLASLEPVPINLQEPWLKWEGTDDARAAQVAATYSVNLEEVLKVYIYLARTNLRTTSGIIGLWPLLAYMNHSCVGNVKVEDVDTITKQVTTLLPVCPLVSSSACPMPMWSGVNQQRWSNGASTSSVSMGFTAHAKDVCRG